MKKKNNMKMLNIKNYFLAGFILVMFSFLFANNTFAESMVNITYETDPLFSDLNILPGDESVKWVKVQNGLDENLIINVVVDSYDDSDTLASQMSISIDSGTTNYYNDDLDNFFTDGGAHLLSLSPGELKQYDFTIKFQDITGNFYQGKSLSFNISIGVVGEDSDSSQDIASSGGRTGTYIAEKEEPIVKGKEGFPQLSIKKESSRDLFNPGEQVEYTLNIENQGNLTAVNVILNDRLPNGFSFVSNGSDKKTWNLGDINAGEYRTISYLVNISGDIPDGRYVNFASIIARNNERMEASDSVEVEKVNVLGVEYELPASGFSVREFVFLFSLFVFSIVSRIFLKKNAF